MKVVVLATSYPTPENEMAGNFVAASVEAARGAGIDVSVVSPGSFPHFGIALGAGIAQNLRAAPWKLGLVPPFLVSFSLAARRAASGADLVHAHWIPSAVAARATRKPYVLQVWGTDVAVAQRAPRLVGPLIRSARAVVAASAYLADEARRLGARKVAIVPVPVELPPSLGEPAQPPHVLFVGRLSEEKGILEFLAATEGMARVVVGDGPLRDRVADAVGYVPPSELAPYFARATVVCVPSRREGYGMTAREALAHGRPVVATRVGGLADLEGPGVTLVPTRDSAALRSAIESALASPTRPQPAGLSPHEVGVALRDVYEAALR